MSIIVDAHEEIAWNTLCFGRDYLNSVYHIRRHEANGPVETVTGVAMLGLPEWLKGGVAVIGATLFTPPERRRTSLLEQHYSDADEAHALALHQIAIYEPMAQQSDQIKLIRPRRKPTWLTGIHSCRLTCPGGAGGLTRRVPLASNWCMTALISR